MRVYAIGLDPDRAAREAVTMRMLERAGYPTPPIVHFEPNTALLGAPFLVMDYLAGGTLWESGRTNAEIAEILASLLADLHRIQPGAIGETPLDPLGWVAEAGGRVAATFPGFASVIDWVDVRLPAIDRRCVPAHLDFHPGNVLLDEDGEAFVIDWTSFRLTDPRLDLTWALLLGEMYEGTEITERFAARYLELAGPQDDLGFFEVVTAVRRLSDILYFLTPEGVGMVTDIDAVIADAHRLVVAEEWIHRNTGVYVPEVEAMLDSVG